MNVIQKQKNIDIFKFIKCTAKKNFLSVCLRNNKISIKKICIKLDFKHEYA